MGLEARAVMPVRSGGRHIDAADVIALLREVYAEGIGTREEAEELIAFDRSLADVSPGWTEFFATTVADHVVRRQAQARLVGPEDAAWLIRAFGQGRHAATAGGLAAILRIIETARDVPTELAAYAIRQVRSAVLAYKRPASTVRLLLHRAIDSETAVLVRRIVLGCAGQAFRPVSRAEAEALFDLHDLTANSENDADFGDLFFKAVTHHLLGASGAAVPPRSAALARQSDFPNAPTGKIALGADETAWLASQIMRDGRPTAAEFRLLQFFTCPLAVADPALRPLATRAA